MTSSDIATAIVATARTYEADPIRALTDKNSPDRRCLAPAVYALKSEGFGSLGGLCAMLGFCRQSAQRARRRARQSGSPAFLTAFVEARRALQGRT